MDLYQTQALQRGMKTLRDSIPQKDRCKKCDGEGQTCVGCATTHPIYETCFDCFGSGRKSPESEAIELLHEYCALLKEHGTLSDEAQEFFTKNSGNKRFARWAKNPTVLENINRNITQKDRK